MSGPRRRSGTTSGAASSSRASRRSWRSRSPLPAAYYTARYPLSRPDAVHAARARRPRCSRRPRWSSASIASSCPSGILPAAGVNTYVSLILVNAAFNLAFSTWIMSGYFSTIPVELEEAAAIDGAATARGPATGDPAARAAGHRDGHHLHVHRRLERVRGRTHPGAIARDQAPDGGRHRVHRPVPGGVAVPVRLVGGRHRARGGPVHRHRDAGSSVA